MKKLFVYLFDFLTRQGELVNTNMSASGQWAQITIKTDEGTYEVSIMKKDEEINNG